MKKEKKIPNFNVPEGYFETFEERLFCKIAEDSFPKTAGFNVPENYFETLETSTLNKVIDSEKTKKVVALFPKKYFGYAAAVAACLLIGFTIFNNKNSESKLEALQLAAIDTYIEEGNLNLDIYELTSYIEDRDITNLDLNFNFDTQQFSDNALEDYILENFDAETIINEQ